MEVSKAERFRDNLLEWSQGNLRQFLWRDPDASLYEVLMSEFFLSRTRAQVVARVMPVFFETFPDMAAISAADEEEMARVIRPTGLQNRRASALNDLAETCEEEGLPRTPEKLKSLPRVGEYTAHATLCFADGQPLFIRDTNVTRIFQRILGEEWPEDEDEQANLLSLLVPPGRPRRYNMALLDFGDAICSARSPDCEECFAASYCAYYN